VHQAALDNHEAQEERGPLEQEPVSECQPKIEQGEQGQHCATQRVQAKIGDATCRD